MRVGILTFICLHCFLTKGQSVVSDDSGGNELKSQNARRYIQKLDSTADMTTYLNLVEKMVQDQYADKVIFQSEEFKSILDVTRKKEFAAVVLPRIYGWMGSMYGNGRFDEAVQYFLESAGQYEQEGKKLEQALVCFEVGLVQHKARNFYEAREYYRKTLEIGEGIIDARTLIGCYNGLGLIFREENKYIEAVNEFKKALQIAHQHDDIAWVGILKGNIGGIFRMQQQYDSSLYYYFQNLKYIRNTPEVENIVETYAQLGRVYVYKHDYRKGKIYLDSSLLVLKNSRRLLTDFFNPMDMIYQSYSILYAETGDYKKAFDYYKKFHEVEDQKEKGLKGRSLVQLQSAYAFKKNQTDLDFLQRINTANQTIIAQQRYMQAASFIVILLLGASALVVYNTSRQRKKLNLELNRANAELERSNATKDKLFSVLSHDLRSPINNLRGVLQLARRGLMEKELFDDVSGKLDEQLESTSNTMNNLLQWSRSEMSGTTMQRESMMLSEVTSKILQQFDIERERKNITIKNSIGSERTVTADREQYEIIIRNLVGNAIKFTHPGGEVHVSASLAGGKTEIVVEDNGTGMKDEDLNNLFKPGRHLSKPGTLDERGTGIGLVITKEMILSNQGDIRVESTWTKGSRFIVTLPQG